jgi:cyanophycinase-like exopeptidase
MPKGSLALVGSGEYLPAMASLEQSLIQDGIKNGKKARFIQIPTAAGQESADRIAFWRELGRAQGERLGVEVEFLEILNRQDAQDKELAELIVDSALIYLSGGDPHHLADSLAGTPVLGAIYQGWASGSSLAGCSAGAMALSTHIPNFRFSKKSPTPGFNFLPKVRVIPHFDRFFRWIPESAAKVLMSSPDDTILIGIDELTALVKRSEDDFFTVEGEASVHILSGANPEILKSGERFTLKSQ